METILGASYILELDDVLTAWRPQQLLDSDPKSPSQPTTYTRPFSPASTKTAYACDCRACSSFFIECPSGLPCEPYPQFDEISCDSYGSSFQEESQTSQTSQTNTGRLTGDLRIETPDGFVQGAQRLSRSCTGRNQEAQSRCTTPSPTPTVQLRVSTPPISEAVPVSTLVETLPPCSPRSTRADSEPPNLWKSCPSPSSSPASPRAVLGFRDGGSPDQRNPSATYLCRFPGCTAPPFQTQYLLADSHANTHESTYLGVCPFCPHLGSMYFPRDYLQQHIRHCHAGKATDDPGLQEAFTVSRRVTKFPRRRRTKQLLPNGPSPTTQQAEATSDTKTPLLSPPPPPPPPLDRSNDSSNKETHSETSCILENHGAPGISDAEPQGGGPEAPFTDSAYESMQRRADRAADASYEGRPDSEVEQDYIEHGDETRTTISAASTVIPTVAQQSIFEICNDIYDRVRRHVDEKNRDSFFRIFPDRIKAFAIRLAHLDSNGLDRRIIRFLYSRRVEITSQLRHMFQAADEEDSFCKHQGGMSVEEKMRLWESNPPDRSPEPPDASDCFQGAADANESITPPELPLSGRAVLDSEAYEWFIGTLLKEATFHWDCSLPRIMVDVIRRQIISALPKDRVSKARNPRIHEAIFEIPWTPLEQRLFRQMDFQKTTIDNALPDAIVLVGSADDYTQASTVEEYAAQTWGPGSKNLLRLLGAAFRFKVEAKSPQRRTASYGSTKVWASISAGYLSVLVQGVAHSIAEHGEQLAWLSAVLQAPTDWGILTDCTPSIIQVPSVNVWEIRTTATPSINADSSILSSVLEKLGWSGKPTEPVVVRGFPTPRRPSSFLGLELSPKILASLTSNESLDSTNALRLTSTDGHLKLARFAQGVCLWHVVTAADEPCRCRTEPGLSISNDIKRYRHIVGDCASLKDLSNDAATSLHVGKPCNHKSMSSTPSDSANLRNRRTSLGSTTDVPMTSLDSRMMSVPVSPDVPSCHIPNELSPIIDTVARRLFRGYQDWYACILSASDSISSECSPTTVSDTRPDLETVIVCAQPNGEPPQNDGEDPTDRNASATAAASKPQDTSRSNGKRRRVNDGEDERDADDGQGNMRPPKAPKRAREAPGRKALACPFWKLEPDRHRKCLKLEHFLEVNRVKQHLTRKHTPIYCERCKILFGDEAAHQQHLQDPGPVCIFKPWDERNGIARPQKDELHKKSKAGQSESEQWFAIWRILFPSRLPPTSPYIDRGLSDDFCRFREYARGQGRRLLLDELHAAGLFRAALPLEGDIESYRVEAVNRGLDMMFEAWLSSQSSLNGGSSRPGGGTRSELSGNETVASLSADSGVGLRSVPEASSVGEGAPLADESLPPLLGIPDDTQTPSMGFSANNDNLPPAWAPEGGYVLGDDVGVEPDFEALAWQFPWVPDAEASMVPEYQPST